MFYKIKCPYETLNIPKTGESFRCRISDMGFRRRAEILNPKTEIYWGGESFLKNNKAEQ